MLPAATRATPAGRSRRRYTSSSWTRPFVSPDSRSSPPEARRSERFAAAEGSQGTSGIRRLSVNPMACCLDGPEPRWLSLSTLTCNVCRCRDRPDHPQGRVHIRKQAFHAGPPHRRDPGHHRRQQRIDRAKLKLDTTLDEFGITSLKLIEAVFEIETQVRRRDLRPTAS